MRSMFCFSALLAVACTNQPEQGEVNALDSLQIAEVDGPPAAPSGLIATEDAVYVEIDAYLAYLPDVDSAGVTSAQMVEYSEDGGETSRASRLVFRFWTDAGYVCTTTATVHNADAEYDAVIETWNAGDHESYVGPTVQALELIDSDCDISDANIWEDWFAQWEPISIGFEYQGVTDSDGMVDGDLRFEFASTTEQRAGYAYRMTSLGAVVQPLEDLDIGTLNRPLLLVSDGQTRISLPN